MKNRDNNVTTILLALGFLALGSFALPRRAQAVSPPPDGCYPNFTTAEGCDALSLLTTGTGNTALGWRSLFLDTTGNFNTGVGGGALALNNADSNTAVGAAALLLNTSGSENTANGTDALAYNTTGNDNTAVGAFALFSNISSFNTAVGDSALFGNTSGDSNDAFGAFALINNTSGRFNSAVGNQTLNSNTTGNRNNAFGGEALQNLASGDDNIAVGTSAGESLTTGSGNVYVGVDSGQVIEDDHTYIRNINTTSVSGAGTDTVTVNLSTGLLGHLTSSRRYKEDIKPMESASETLYRLKPVTYRYKKEIDPSQSLDYGLTAEDVAQVDRNLANRNRDGQIESVRYNAINAMLLNEFLKEHKIVQELKSTIQKQEAIIAKQQKRFESKLAEQEKRIEALTSYLQRVSAQIEAQNEPTKIVINDP